MAADDPIGTGDAPPPASGGGIKSWSNGKKAAVFGGGAVVVGVIVFLFARSRSNSSSSSTAQPPATTLIAPAPPVTGGDTGGGGSAPVDLSGLSNSLSQSITAGDATIAAALASFSNLPAPVVNITGYTPAGGGSNSNSNSNSSSNSGGSSVVPNTATKPSWASTSFLNPNTNVQYFGVPNPGDVSKAQAQGYHITTAKAAGVPGGSTTAKYAYK